MMPVMSNTSTFSCVDRTLQFAIAFPSAVVGVVRSVGATAAIGLSNGNNASPKLFSSRSHRRILDIQAKQGICCRQSENVFI